MSAIEKISVGGTSYDVGVQHGVYELWYNNDLTTFAGQDINISDDYDTYIVECGDTAGSVIGVAFVEHGKNSYATYITFRIDGTVRFSWRNCTSTTGKITFSDCTRRTVTLTTGVANDSTVNSELIPLRVLGIKHNN